jgi:hypothetical protein
MNGDDGCEEVVAADEIAALVMAKEEAEMSGA